MITLFCFISVTDSFAATAEDMNRRYSVQIEIKNAYISGLCIMRAAEETITSSIVNEFGVSALTFSYDIRKEKVKIISIMKQMDRFHIRKVLKSDLRKIMRELQTVSESECYDYSNKRIDIQYSFKPLVNQHI